MTTDGICGDRIPHSHREMSLHPRSRPQRGFNDFSLPRSLKQLMNVMKIVIFITDFLKTFHVTIPTFSIIFYIAINYKFRVVCLAVNSETQHISTSLTKSRVG